ncbi:ABC transporter ATP-binding protein [Angustibacter sp. Root456]|uniref:ABC transporter ATP-binding protein n=1 Tax=Angustibacter sp. Root456 TaxID=1736539 RepID=UPI0006F57EB3|nr:ABC transporter ATP-binding protein [Angustibacter sp. Root456]KQX62851.1 ABC transporter ATP-binding protein [Angustibacter sp. Root456]
MSLRLDGAVSRGGFTVEARLDVADGEVVVLLGPNGAGKTTLLRAIAGLEPLGRGQIEIAGQVVDDAGAHFVPPERRRVGLVFQDYRLVPHLSVLDNVAFSARVSGAGRRAARERARPWLERLDLTDLAGRRPAQLSGGQAQRVALARALAMEPHALLLDEPLAALDARTRLEVRLALRRHVEQFDGPVVAVTHDAVEAMVLADRLLVVEAGRVVQQGAPADVARRPATDYVARLVGLNLLAGRAADAEGLVTLDAGGELRGAAADVRAGDRVLVSVPPHAVSLHAEHPVPGSARNVWQGTVDGLEPLHDRVRVHVDAQPPVLVDVTPGAVAELRLVPGARVWLTVKATEVEVYPDPAPTPRP